MLAVVEPLDTTAQTTLVLTLGHLGPGGVAARAGGPWVGGAGLWTSGASARAAGVAPAHPGREQHGGHGASRSRGCRGGSEGGWGGGMAVRYLWYGARTGAPIFPFLDEGDSDSGSRRHIPILDTEIGSMLHVAKIQKHQTNKQTNKHKQTNKKTTPGEHERRVFVWQHLPVPVPVLPLILIVCFVRSSISMAGVCWVWNLKLHCTPISNSDSAACSIIRRRRYNPHNELNKPDLKCEI